MHIYRAPRAAVTLLATGVLAAGCYASPETPAPHPSVSASQESTPSTSSIATASKVTARICEAIFTQKNEDGSSHVIGRPVVDSLNFPQEVDVNPTGIEITATHLGGMVTWYTLKGQKLNAEDLDCHDAELRAREIDQPMGITWDASTVSDKPVKMPLDVHALNPDGAGIAGLDFGNVSAFDLGDILQAASR
ncbi:MAG TPA: hypothetical protein VLG11_04915 [Candidatus Saccharimonadales bacterium]|nr:hypothetical protein [Candidatus Saccharimonadales bacterium]